MRGHHLLIASAPPHGLCMVKVSPLYHASCHVPALLTHRASGCHVSHRCCALIHAPRHHLTCPCSGASTCTIPGPRDSILPSDTHAPSLVPGIACFLPIHDLARSLSSLLVLIRLTRPVVYLSPGLCLTIPTTARSLSGRTAVWLNPTHPLRQMSVCLHTLKVTGVCTWDFRDETLPVWYNLMAAEGKRVKR